MTAGRPHAPAGPGVAARGHHRRPQLNFAAPVTGWSSVP
jgi:hypothetical protein